MIPNKVKLVIWDLDDTFWKGTLAEGPVDIPLQNSEILVTLAKRGIVSSISSKNDFEPVRKILEEKGLWFYFVFPQIRFAPKGAAIADLVERMNLRADNVLFVDDNHLNLEEARYFSPTLMTAHPDEILPHILALDQCRGKTDTDLSRLHQYKLLETKFEAQNAASGSSRNFLRECNITVDIDIDVDGYFDRVLELVNRSNQLNFTKQRLETEEAIAEFKKRLGRYGHHAGVVKVTDRYGDYGVVGFYMTSRFAGDYQLLHFVFSCRIMNMGIEQYVYESLGKPIINIVGPVASGLDDLTDLDWISSPSGKANPMAGAEAGRLLLIGGCDLLQVATYCSKDRLEFVNAVNRGVMIRYDDPGFVLSSRAEVLDSQVLPLVPCWTKEDAHRFDQGLAEAKTVIVSMWEAMDGDYIVIGNGILIRIDSRYLGKSLGRQQDRNYLQHLRFASLGVRQKLELLRRSLDRIVGMSSAAENLFLLSAPTRLCGRDSGLRLQYNSMAEDYCRDCPAFEFVSLDDVIPASEILDVQHFTRKGYFSLASDLIRRINTRGKRKICRRPSDMSEIGFADILAHSTDLALLDGVLSPMKVPEESAATATQHELVGEHGAFL